MPNVIEEFEGYAASAQVAILSEAMVILEENNKDLAESLAGVSQMLAWEDRGWDLLWGSNDAFGIQRLELIQISEKIREMVVGSPIVKRGAQLRASYVWSKGMQIEGALPSGTSGRPTALQNFYADPVNKQYLFSSDAHEILERAAYTDGNVFFVGDNETKKVRTIPVWEISGELRNPDFNDEIWAYQRTWNSWTVTGGSKPNKEWYYTNRYTGTKRTSINRYPVNSKKTILVKQFNRQAGWAWGIPDAISIVAWARLYSEFLKNGKIMTQALAQFAFKAVVKTKTAGDNASVKLAGKSTGATAVTGDANDLVPLNSAGRGYDFDSGRALAAMVATGIEVSLIHLLSDPGAAGSSYGSAQSLDLPTKRAIVSRQRSWADFYTEVLEWAGVKNPKVSFEQLDDPDYYREIQALLLGFGSGAIDWDEFRPKLLSLLNIESKHDTEPDGAMLPNNSHSLDRLDIDNDAAGGSAANGGGLTPTQGSGAKSVKSKGKNANDLRSDTLANALVMAQSNRLEEMMEEIRGMVSELRK